MKTDYYNVLCLLWIGIVLSSIDGMETKLHLWVDNMDICNALQ